MSSSDLAMTVRGLSKSYSISRNREQYLTLTETLLHRFKSALSRPERETFWALKSIEFDIRRGEVVGIIGRNGAGKSTLLKILSRITEPTTGEIDLYGRVGSLLEVGTGFHPELTGRENVYLNGAILGMTRREIAARFDEIVDFAEVEQFLDTPVKRYSSGMYVRLAFAVAAHLNPEILIVDEVLAVGDGAFQQKCLGKMGDVARAGRTVLFVSHNMEAVRRLCTRAILLETGGIVQDAPAAETLRTYFDRLRAPTELASIGLSNRLNRTSGAVRITQFTAHDRDGNLSWSFEPGDAVTFRIDYEAFESVPSLGIYIAISSCLTREVVTSIKLAVCCNPVHAGDAASFVIEVPDCTLRPGNYSLYVALGSDNCDIFYDVIDENVSIPLLSITSDELDPHRTVGYFSLEAHIEDRGARLAEPVRSK